MSRQKSIYLSYLLIGLGLGLLSLIAWPVFDYYVVSASELGRQDMKMPVSLAYAEELHQSSLPLGEETVFGKASISMEPSQTDFTKASSWFVGTDPVQKSNLSDKYPDEYVLTIPEVDVYDARVVVGSNDLSESLIHYAGTAYPGQAGSPVIFGHSVLRQFYNPKVSNPRRYMSIFSKIMTLEAGDEIEIEYDGVLYTYQVTDKYQVEPEDVYILQQNYGQANLKLVTCVPEGTYLRRGVVEAKLLNMSETTRT